MRSVRRHVQQVRPTLKTEVFVRTESLVGALPRRIHALGGAGARDMVVLRNDDAGGNHDPSVHGRAPPLFRLQRRERCHGPLPALRELVRGKEYDDLGEEFEDKEHALFGEHGFENMIAEVAKLEQSLGIHDLALFTPR